MHHLEIHTRRELEEFLRVQEDPNFLANWIKEDDEQTEQDRVNSDLDELNEFRDELEWAEQLNEEELNSDMQKMREELSSLNQDTWRAYLLNGKLKICEEEICRRRK